MARHRIQRVNEQIKREVARLLVGEVRDPRVGPVTVTRVIAAPDLTLARIFVQLLGDDEERRTTMEGLEGATPFIRSALADRVPMRRVPELRFEIDESLEHALKIERLLAEAAMGEDREDEDPEDEDPEYEDDAGEDGDPQG